MYQEQREQIATGIMIVAILVSLSLLAYDKLYKKGVIPADTFTVETACGSTGTDKGFASEVLKHCPNGLYKSLDYHSIRCVKADGTMSLATREILRCYDES